MPSAFPPCAAHGVLSRRGGDGGPPPPPLPTATATVRGTCLVPPSLRPFPHELSRARDLTQFPSPVRPRFAAGTVSQRSALRAPRSAPVARWCTVCVCVCASQFASSPVRVVALLAHLGIRKQATETMRHSMYIRVVILYEKNKYDTVILKNIKNLICINMIIKAAKRHPFWGSARDRNPFPNEKYVRVQTNGPAARRLGRSAARSAGLSVGLVGWVGLVGRSVGRSRSASVCYTANNMFVHVCFSFNALCLLYRISHTVHVVC